MFALFLVASFVLPSLMEACCFPTKLYMEALTAGGKDSDEVWVDFNQNKYIIKPETGDEVFILNDLANKLTYTRYQNGTCSKQGLLYPLIQCFHNFDESHTSILAGSVVETFHVGYEVEINDDLKHHGKTGATVVLKKGDCTPVMAAQTNAQGTRTRIYMNVATNIDNMDIFDHDISDCVQI